MARSEVGIVVEIRRSYGLCMSRRRRDLSPNALLITGSARKTNKSINDWFLESAIPLIALIPCRPCFLAAYLSPTISLNWTFQAFHTALWALQFIASFEFVERGGHPVDSMWHWKVIVIRQSFVWKLILICSDAGRNGFLWSNRPHFEQKPNKNGWRKFYSTIISWFDINHPLPVE